MAVPKPVPETPGISLADLLQLQWLAAAYWARADGATKYAIIDLFTEDSVLTLGALTLTGLRDIEAFFLERDASHRAAGRTTRHVASNFLALPEGEGRVLVRSTVLVFAGQGPLPLPVVLPSGIADFEDVCVSSAPGRWKYLRRTGRSIFIGADAPSFVR
ncbi:MAG: nuclear transport factor 2 family protein [Gammaproteobacteria bacterium]